MDIGFIGLGLMGREMARRLVAAGHRVTVFNRSRAIADELGAAGAIVGDTAAAAVRGAEVAITMLADDAAVQAVWLDTGLASQLPRGAVHANMATTSVPMARSLAAAHAAHGGQYVSAPVFGRPPVAAQGQIDVIAAGPEAALATCRPLFDAMAKQVFVVGEDPARANAVKIARNFMMGNVIHALAESTALVRRFGVDAGTFVHILTNTSLAAPAYKNYGKIMVDRSYVKAQATMHLGMKDLGLALSTAESLGVDMPIARLMRSQLQDAIDAGLGDYDWVGLTEHIARRAGLE